MSAQDDIIPKPLRREPDAKLWTSLERDGADHGEPADHEAEENAG